jgi:penicillin-binding protein A
MKDISKNVKKVLIIYLLCFIGLISYITYFEMVKAPVLSASQYNRRLWAKRNEVLRGTIYDKNMKPLTKSTRISSDSQKIEYTDGELFAHVLGYVDVKYGLTGLQYRYDKELMSTDIKDDLMNYFKSKLNGSKTKVDKVGNGLETTLDYNIQKKAFDLLGDNRGAVVALNPKTGEILALVSKPSFNPNNLEQDWNAINANKDRPLLNRATSGLYPPGSTFKTITAISSLENIDGIMNRTFNDTGRLQFNKTQSLSNFNGEVLGNISFKQAYVYSSNVVFGTLGMELGNDKLKETAEKFYFNKDIPTDGITVDNSRFPELKKYEIGSIAQSAIGQGSVLATPMQMALVASTIANDGTMMKPYLVKEVLNSKGTVLSTIVPETIGDVIPPETAKIMQEFMRGVVKEGTGVNASITGIDVCGKTGTADHTEDGKPATPHSWFIGFAPYNDPQIAVAVIVEDGGQGGIVAARIASDVMAEALNNK